MSTLKSATVVLVHGAIVNGWELLLLRRRLQKSGYQVRQFCYRSMLGSLEENCALLAAFLAKTPGETLHVVGHSMGGVLLRRVFEELPDPRPGRILAIGSPLLDCQVARRVADFHASGYWLTGRTVRDHVRSPIDPLWRGVREFGVLAGTFPLGVGSLLADLPRPNDGVVSWEETRLGGITAHATCHWNHFAMLMSRRCAQQITYFLETGSFRYDEYFIAPATATDAGTRPGYPSA